MVFTVLYGLLPSLKLLPALQDLSSDRERKDRSPEGIGL